MNTRLEIAEIPARAWVVVDTNILVYANQRRSNECVDFLRRCASGELTAVVPVPMVAELVHSLMLIEAREDNLIKRANLSRALAERPDIVRGLKRYQTQVREFFGMGLRIEPAGAADVLEALHIQKETGLLMNDALLLAVAARLNCEKIATADKAFMGMGEFDIYAPWDVA